MLLFGFFATITHKSPKKTFLWLFIIFPIGGALYAFAPTFLAVSLGVFMLIGAVGAVFNAYKKEKVSLKL